MPEDEIGQYLKRRIKELRREIEQMWEDFAHGRPS